MSGVQRVTTALTLKTTALTDDKSHSALLLHPTIPEVVRSLSLPSVLTLNSVSAGHIGQYLCVENRAVFIRPSAPGAEASFRLHELTQSEG